MVKKTKRCQLRPEVNQGNPRKPNFWVNNNNSNNRILKKKREIV